MRECSNCKIPIGDNETYFNVVIIRLGLRYINPITFNIDVRPEDELKIIDNLCVSCLSAMHDALKAREIEGRKRYG